MPLLNNLPDLTELIMHSSGYGDAAAPSNRLSQLFYNNRYVILGNYRQAISATYMTNGLVQKFIDMPVDDGFRYGFKVKSKQLGEKKVRKLLQYVDENRIIDTIATTKKWCRLYGGGGIIVNCDGKTDEPFDIKQIKRNSLLKFIPADLWELAKHDENKPDEWGNDPTEVPYNYYGNELHKTRVLKMKGKEPTSWDRPRLRNWGMSELERILPELNNHMRAMDLVYELLRQFNVNTWKMQGFNDNLGMGGNDGTATIMKRIQCARQVADYLNDIVMDKEDDFEHKQISFSGLAEMLNTIMKCVSSVLNIPMTKLFGISASGFNAGDDDLENYNCMIEHEIRGKSKWIIIDVLQICSMLLFGEFVTDFEIDWKPLRILTAEQEENVKNSQLNRIMVAFSGGLMNSNEAILSINMNNILGIEVSEKNIQSPILQSNGDNVKLNKTGEKTVSPKMSPQEYAKRGYGGSQPKATSNPKPKGVK